MANLYIVISILSTILLFFYNFIMQIFFGNTYMPNLQCLNTITVLHISLTYTHRISMDIYICTHMHTYIIDAHYSCMQIHIHKHTFPCINGCTHILSHMYAQAYVETTHIIIIMVIFKCYFSGELIALS